MAEEKPYASPQSVQDSGQAQRPLFWSRMLRLSIHFTILGIILAGFRVFLVLRRSERVNPDDVSGQVDAMNLTIHTIMSSLGFAALFLIVGLVSIVVSLVMRRVEKKRMMQ